MKTFLQIDREFNDNNPFAIEGGKLRWQGGEYRESSERTIRSFPVGGEK